MPRRSRRSTARPPSTARRARRKTLSGNASPLPPRPNGAVYRSIPVSAASFGRRAGGGHAVKLCTVGSHAVTAEVYGGFSDKTKPTTKLVDAGFGA